MIACFQQGGKILLCGNGGSAADAQHIAAEFVSVLTQSFLRPGMPAIALTTDSSILTASANDFGFEGIFARQVQALGRPGDVLVGDFPRLGTLKMFCGPSNIHVRMAFSASRSPVNREVASPEWLNSRCASRRTRRSTSKNLTS